MNFGVYWDGDLQRELLDNVTISKWDYAGNKANTLLGMTGNSCNGTKATPNLSGDLFGDWREEVILHSSDNKSLIVYTTTTPTTYKFRTLLHDPQYRVAIAWQNSCYNQPPHLGYYLGSDMATPAKPNIVYVGGNITTDVEDSYLPDAKTGTVSCSPNPFTGDTYIQSKGDFNYQVLDMGGNILESGHAQDAVHLGGSLSAGMYLVKISTEEAQQYVKIIKQ